MNSSDPLLAALQDRKLFSGPRPGLVSLMDLDEGAVQWVQVDGVAPPVPRGWVPDIRVFRIMTANTLALPPGLCHGCAFDGKACLNFPSRAGRLAQVLGSCRPGE